MKAIKVSVGDRIKRIGTSAIRREATGQHLEAGCIGTVIEVRKPQRCTGLRIDGELIDDQDHDGYAVVLWPTWGRGLIWPANEGSRWEICADAQA